jgi:hypothetical protein
MKIRMQVIYTEKGTQLKRHLRTPVVHRQSLCNLVLHSRQPVPPLSPHLETLDSKISMYALTNEKTTMTNCSAKNAQQLDESLTRIYRAKWRNLIRETAYGIFTVTRCDPNL